ncbi:hypothetical protein TH25_07695 [Thalassospira profundimaris]|uniref:Uncharacterized protein n=1 Tax=Thalassospira profundimaris TaxID=502049 RepID=A0A367XHY0_9PROT|nr:hypothetical protein TH25_07695 [Thalassospira profundimaris]
MNLCQVFVIFMKLWPIFFVGSYAFFSRQLLPQRKNAPPLCKNGAHFHFSCRVGIRSFFQIIS